MGGEEGGAGRGRGRGATRRAPGGGEPCAGRLQGPGPAVPLAASAEKRRPARRAAPLGAGLPPAGVVVWLHWGPRRCYARRRGSVSPGRYGRGRSGRIQQPDLVPSTPKARRR